MRWAIIVLQISSNDLFTNNRTHKSQQVGHWVWYFLGGITWTLLIFSLLAYGKARGLSFVFGLSWWQFELQQCLWGLVRALQLWDIFHVCGRHLPPFSRWPSSQFWNMPSSAPAAQEDDFHAASSSSLSSSLYVFKLWMEDFHELAGWWWQAELVALVPGAGVSPDEQQYDWRIVGSAMGGGSTPNFSLSLFHEAMAVDVWQHVARWDLKPGLS